MKTKAELEQVLAAIGKKRYATAFAKYEDVVLHVDDVLAATYLMKKEKIAELLNINRSLLSIILNMLKAIKLNYKRKDTK